MERKEHASIKRTLGKQMEGRRSRKRLQVRWGDAARKNKADSGLL